MAWSGRAETSDAILQIVGDIAPASTADTLRGPVEQLVEAPSAGFALVVGILGALWSASGYVGAFSRAMNRIYEVEEGRPVWKLRPQQLLLTAAGLVVAAVVALLLAVSGPVAAVIGQHLGLGDTAQTVWNVARWPILLVLVALGVALLYYAGPNVEQPKFRWISVGAFIAITVWVVASLGFGVYVANFSSYNKTYGALAGVIVFLLWLWITNLALLFGAEVDAELERGRELQAGIAAEDDLKLPLGIPRWSRRLTPRRNETFSAAGSYARHAAVNDYREVHRCPRSAHRAHRGHTCARLERAPGCPSAPWPREQLGSGGAASAVARRSSRSAT